MKKLITSDFIKKWHNDHAYMYSEQQNLYWIYVIPFIENSNGYRYFSQQCDNENDIKKLLDELIASGAYDDDNEIEDENLQFIFPNEK